MTLLDHGRLGTAVSRDDLFVLGFVQHDLRFRPSPDATQSEWDTLGAVPDSPGLYAFVLEHPDWDGETRAAYVGLTTHLWMVTKGRLPGNGGARGPQRYGRHEHAGATRLRINANVTVAVAAGCSVSHWLAARPGTNAAALRFEEESLIRRWRLRAHGWNRG